MSCRSRLSFCVYQLFAWRPLQLMGPNGHQGNIGSHYHRGG